MIDSDGYRKNVGIAIINKNKNIFCARRVGGSFWQMPQHLHKKTIMSMKQYCKCSKRLNNEQIGDG